MQITAQDKHQLIFEWVADTMKPNNQVGADIRNGDIPAVREACKAMF